MIVCGECRGEKVYVVTTVATWVNTPEVEEMARQAHCEDCDNETWLEDKNGTVVTGEVRND